MREMSRLLVLVTAGLSPAMLRGGEARDLLRLGGGRVRPLRPVFPALTAPGQASLLTGVAPGRHGIVANGWFDRARMDLEFWPHGAGLVEAERVSARLRRRRPGATTAAAFLWNLLGSDLDAYVNVNPLTPVGGKMVFSCYGRPGDLNARVEARLGPFPLDRYWGPRADVSSTRWIAEAAKEILRAHAPTLLYVYLSHLDYRPQTHGPAAPEVAADLRALDEVVADLAAEAERDGVRTVALSEYGIRPVSGAVEPNRVLRREGLLAIRSIGGRDYVDWANSRAFAVTDHQVANVYVREPVDRARVSRLLAQTPGVSRVLDEEGKRAAGIGHPRAGDLVLLSAPDRWFAYPFWEEAEKAPDYARAIEIHRKPGYDPLEMVFDPPAGGISWDTSRIRGSHGLVPDEPEHMGVLLADGLEGLPSGDGPVDFLDLARAIEEEAARP
jgi:predicted AlkP superfamily pyrophosphatase or phosphodiesterase